MLDSKILDRSIIFDWGGVLMQTVDREPRFRWDRRLALPKGSVEAVVHGIEAWDRVQLGEIGIVEYWEKVRSQLGLSPTLLAELRNDFYSGDRLNEELITLIKNLRSRGIQIGLLSNNSLELRDMLEAMRLDKLFDALVVSAQIGFMKPAPQAYYIVLEKLKMAPGQALFVDDFQQNIEGALAVGMSVFHFRSNVELHAYIESWLRRHE